MKQKTFLAFFALGIVLFFALFFSQQIFHGAATITLPAHTTETDTRGEAPGTDQLNILSITPTTVQTAIATLSRPVSYQRTQTIELFWDGGTGAFSAQVAVHGDITRVDSTLKDGSICHILLSGTTAAVWYDDELTWITMHSEQLNADSIQRMPTYETVLTLPVEKIEQAEYQLKNDAYCIYVQTIPDDDGYAESYWISVRSGLLLAAERTHNGELIYRFSATEPTDEAPSAFLFRLPDGTRPGSGA